LRPTGSRNVLEKFANAIIYDGTERRALPPSFAPSGLSESSSSLISGRRSPTLQNLSQLSSTGAHGHVLQVVDPAEETFHIPAASSSSNRKAANRSLQAVPSLESGIRNTPLPTIARRSGPRLTNAAGALRSTAPTGLQRNSCWHCTRA